MKFYYCLHCNIELGQWIEGGVQPSCPDHPNGAVTLIEVSDDTE